MACFFCRCGNSEYYAQINIPQNNFGKIESGQKVKLKFASYPYQEFGALEGKLGLINRIPTDSGFVAKVNLPKGLLTNYNKEIAYHTGLSATAEIVTANTSLAERIFNQLISVVKN